jgi:hypothetical protein
MMEATEETTEVAMIIMVKNHPTNPVRAAGEWV